MAATRANSRARTRPKTRRRPGTRIPWRPVLHRAARPILAGTMWLVNRAGWRRICGGIIFGLSGLAVLGSLPDPGNQADGGGRLVRFLGQAIQYSLGGPAAWVTLIAGLGAGFWLMAGSPLRRTSPPSPPRPARKATSRPKPVAKPAVEPAREIDLRGLTEPVETKAPSTPAASPGALGPKPLPEVPTTPPGIQASPTPFPDRGSATFRRWPLPSIDLLKIPSGGSVAPTNAGRRAAIIEDTLASFGIEARVVQVRQGPSVTRFGLEPAPGVKVARIAALANDLALRLAAAPLRIESPVPGEAVVGIEVPNEVISSVSLRGLLESPAFLEHKGSLKLALGRDVAGKPLVADLARMPHVLIAGATGSGKSVCLNSFIAALLLGRTPDELQMIMVDPKMVEMMPYNGIPHLLTPVVTDMAMVVPSLRWVVKEMERRYRLFADKGHRNIDAHNKAVVKAKGLPLPYIVVVIDELADLMMTSSGDVEPILCRLAQLARATGIHLVVATQRPSVNVITGLIKANFPTRISFAVTSQVDSRTILDHAGAEKLLGKGDGLYQAPDAPAPARVQGAFVSDAELGALVEFWKSARPSYGDLQYAGAAPFELLVEEEVDVLYARAVQLIEEHEGRVSASFLQRRLRIGYNRATRLMEELREAGELDDDDGGGG